jgi:hypothetical protein
MGRAFTAPRSAPLHRVALGRIHGGVALLLSLSLSSLSLGRIQGGAVLRCWSLRLRGGDARACGVGRGCGAPPPAYAVPPPAYAWPHSLRVARPMEKGALIRAPLPHSLRVARRGLAVVGGL